MARAEAQKQRGAEAQKQEGVSVRPSWSGPPGCTCDLTMPAKNRCSKGGWLRCQGALNAMMAQMRYRDGVGKSGGKAKKGKTFLEILIKGQKETGQC